MICDNYTPRKYVAELLSAKDEEINWLRDEIKYLRQKIELILEIVGKGTEKP